jgi:hypothetical protein
MQRYDALDEGMEQNGDGDYVLHSDAVANEAAAEQRGRQAERRDAARKLLAEVKRLEAIDEAAHYYSSHAQGLYNYVRKEYADIISKELA